MAKVLNWGIIGNGSMASDFVTSGLAYLNPKEHKFLGIASRNIENAKSFAGKYGIKKVFQTYDDLAKDPEIEIVYVGTPNHTHFRLAKLSLDYGKHVLVESMFCMNVRETKELLEYAKSKKLFIMEGNYGRFLPAYRKLKEELSLSSVGDVKQLLITFGYSLYEDMDRLRYSKISFMLYATSEIPLIKP